MKHRIKLPERHRRSLSVVARIIEETLDELEALLTRRNGRGVTYNVERVFAEDECQELLSAISEMRRANREMFSDLELEPSHLREDRILQAKTAHLWVVLVDSKSGSLKGFGELPEATARVVDEHVDKLLALLEKIHPSRGSKT